MPGLRARSADDPGRPPVRCRLEELHFDDLGGVEVFFVPVRTGNFTFRVRGLEEGGMAGNLIGE